MANINLLPWREERRQELKQEFMILLGFAAGIAVVILLAIGQLYSMSIDNQNGRNNYIGQEISQLDAQIREIKELESKRDQLLARMRIIQDLQGNRPVIVRLFDELVRTLPDGVFYTSVKFEEDDRSINLQGIAESNNKVSSLMRAFDASEWFVAPLLTSVTASPKDGENANLFKMTVTLANPDSEEGDE